MQKIENRKPFLNTTIPFDWEVKTVGESFEICNNLRLPINELEREKMKGPYPYYGPTKIQDYINEYRLDGVYALIGEDGDHFLKWKDLPMTLLVNGKFNVNNHAHIIRGTDNLTEWFFYFFNHRELTPYLTRQGAGRYKLTKDSLRKILCALPPINEQKAIAHILGLMDTVINKNNQLITQKELQKKWLMQNLLTGKKRLKGFEKGKWKEVKLGSLLELINGVAFKPEEWTKNGTPIIRIQNLNGSSEFNFYDKEVERRYLVNYNDLLFAWSGSRGTSFGSFVWTGELAILNQHIFKVIPKEGIKKEFAFQILRWLTVKIERKAHGSAGLVHVRKKQLEDEHMTVPISLKEQDAIALVLQTADKEIQLLKAKTEKLKEQKKGLMQVLLTGKKRLKIDKD